MVRPPRLSDPNLPPSPVRAAATVVLLRDSTDGPEVLMLRRHGGAGFAADAWVFPGGVVDEADRRLEPTSWSGIDPEALAERFSSPPDLVLGFHVAAVREAFEEAGLLLAAKADGSLVDVAAADVQQLRRGLIERSATAGDFARWLRDAEVVLDLGALAYWSRWVTPAQEPRRYDTPFFVARAREGQAVVHDRTETTGQRWIRPRDALDEHAAGRLFLIYPTIRNLEEMAEFATVAELLAAAGARSEVRSIQPHIVTDDEGRYVRILHPDEPGYPHDRYEGSRR